MAAKTLFVCSNCGHKEPKWLGRCPDCGEWSTFVEEAREDKKAVVGFAARAANAKGPKRTTLLDRQDSRPRCYRVYGDESPLLQEVTVLLKRGKD